MSKLDNSCLSGGNGRGRHAELLPPAQAMVLESEVLSEGRNWRPRHHAKSSAGYWIGRGAYRQVRPPPFWSSLA